MQINNIIYSSTTDTMDNFLVRVKCSEYYDKFSSVKWSYERVYCY